MPKQSSARGTPQPDTATASNLTEQHGAGVTKEASAADWSTLSPWVTVAGEEAGEMPGSGGGALGVAIPESGGGPLGMRGLGFHPDLPDARDLRIDVPGPNLPPEVTRVLSEITAQLGNTAVKWCLRGERTPPSRVNLRVTGLLPPIQDQGHLNSCTAQAVIAMVEYLIAASGADPLDMSSMFLYKTSRRLLGWTGDTGAYLRTTIKALALFGTPPEREWPYNVASLDTEPDAYHYSFAQNFKALAYARLDGYGSGGNTTKETIKKALADGFPVAFGFPVYDSIDQVSGRQGYIIPFPTRGRRERLRGGHAVLAVGYDDAVATHHAGGTAGALIVRNSWGTGWGDGGYAYLPYEYVVKQFATDFWSVFNKDWVKLNRFD